MKALILAAGYATRLYPLTKDYPKSLLRIRGRPIIDYLLSKLDGITGLDEVIVVTNSKFIGAFRRWRLRHPHKEKISLVDDLTADNASRRGAIGDLIFVLNRKRIKDDLLVVGGDNLFDAKIDGFLKFARGRRGMPTIGVYDIGRKTEARKYGVVKLGKNKRIIDFSEKPPKPKSSTVAMCLYYFPRARLSLIREYGRKGLCQDASGFYIDWLSKRVPVYGFIFRGCWYDIGDHKFYNRAKKGFAEKHGGSNGFA